MRRLAFLLPLLVVAAILIFLGCQKQQTPAASSSSSQASAFTLTLATDPAPPVESNDTTFKVLLTDTSGKPVSGALVKAELKMATMDMGKNEVSFAEKQPGRYEGTGKFTMAGPWNVIVTAKQGDNTGQQVFEVVAHRKE